MIEDDEIIGRSNNLSQNMAKLRKSKNCQILAKSKKSSHLKLSKKAILNKSEILVNSTIATNTDTMGYLTSKAREVFTQLRQPFIKAPILRYFDLKYYIRIETNTSGFAIGRIFSQLNFDWISLDSLKLDKSNFGQ